MDQLRKDHPKICKGKSNSEIAKTSFIWIDDGKNDLNGVTIKNQWTGEVQTFNFQENF